jgi:hypothetical protein
MQIRRKNRVHILIAASVTSISLLACEPVIAIGWKEIFYVFIFAAILLGPPLYRLIRRAEEFLKHEKKDK